MRRAIASVIENPAASAGVFEPGITQGTDQRHRIEINKKCRAERQRQGRPADRQALS